MTEQPEAAAKAAEAQDKAREFATNAVMCTHAGVMSLAQPLYEQIAALTDKLTTVTAEREEASTIANDNWAIILELRNQVHHLEREVSAYENTVRMKDQELASSQQDWKLSDDKSIKQYEDGATGFDLGKGDSIQKGDEVLEENKWLPTSLPIGWKLISDKSRGRYRRCVSPPTRNDSLSFGTRREMKASLRSQWPLSEAIKECEKLDEENEQLTSELSAHAATIEGLKRELADATRIPTAHRLLQLEENERALRTRVAELERERDDLSSRVGLHEYSHKALLARSTIEEEEAVKKERDALQSELTNNDRIARIRARVKAYCDAVGQRPETTEGEIFRLVTQKWGAKSGADITLKLAEECGEVAGAVIRVDEERGNVDAIADELGDVLIVASQLAFLIGSTLEEIRAERWENVKNRP